MTRLRRMPYNALRLSSATLSQAMSQTGLHGTGMAFDSPFHDNRPTKPLATHGHGPVPPAGLFQQDRSRRTTRLPVSTSTSRTSMADWSRNTMAWRR